MIVEQFLKDFQPVEKTVWHDEPKLKSDIAELRWEREGAESETVLIVKPKTYMNNSGMAVHLITSFYKLSTEDLWVVYDDLDLPVGTMKIRFGGAAAGHHGVENIMDQLGTDKFWRFRFGIGLPHGHKQDSDGQERMQSRRTVGPVDDYVLSQFGTKDRNKIREMIKYGSESLQLALEKDIETAQNRFNTK
jgi:PTH1 family peptidyl-tRNA hydrolase